MESIEDAVEQETHTRLPQVDDAMTVQQRRSTSFVEVGCMVFAKYPKRAVLGLSLFIGPAIAIGNLFGPLLLGAARAYGPAYATGR